MSGVRSHIAVLETLDGQPLPLPPKGGATAMQTYMTDRDRLVEAEKSKRFDAEKLRSLSNEEAKANAVVDRLKEKEDAKIYSPAGDNGAMKGMSWEGAKARGVQDGELYKMIGKMPKGAVLHCHMDGTVDARWIIERVLQVPNLFMLSSAPLTTPASLYTSHVLFRILPQDGSSVDAEGGYSRAGPSGLDIYSPSYQPNTWVPLHPMRLHFPHDNVYRPAPSGYEREVSVYSNSSTTQSAFDAYLHSLMTLTPVPAHVAPPIQTSKQAWDKFISTFGAIGGLSQNEEVIRDYFKKSFETFVKDRVSYVEARINFFSETFISKSGHPTLTHADLLAIFQSALQEVQSGLPSDCTFDAKVIYSTVRIIDCNRLRWYIDDAISLKQHFPHLLVGFDLVGHEDAGGTLRDYAPELLRMKERIKELDLDLPLVLHAGETTSDGDAIDGNLYDAILLGSRRIGHGFSLIQHPLLIDMVKSRGICIESCPISNQLLRFTSSTAIHPVLPLLARSVPVAIGNDDPTQFQNPGLTPDFYQLLSASNHFTLSSLGVLARNSINYALLDNEDKQRLLAQWDRDWSLFIAQIAASA